MDTKIVVKPGVGYSYRESLLLVPSLKFWIRDLEQAFELLKNHNKWLSMHQYFLFTLALVQAGLPVSINWKEKEHLGPVKNGCLPVVKNVTFVASWFAEICADHDSRKFLCAAQLLKNFHVFKYSLGCYEGWYYCTWDRHLKIFPTNFVNRILNWQQGNEKKDAIYSVRCSFVRHSERKTCSYAQAERGECGPGEKMENGILELLVKTNQLLKDEASIGEWCCCLFWNE